MLATAGLAVTGCSTNAGTDAASGGPSTAGSTSSPAAAGSSPAGTGATGTTGATSSAPAPSASGASGGTPGATQAGTSPLQAAPAPELPRGGRTLFPTYRLVGFSGAPGAEALGKLGIGKLDDRARDIEKQAAPYARGRQILPVFELIATVTHRRPGKDGQYRGRADDKVIQEYLDAARRAKGVLLLNIQPGIADFLPEVQAYEKWLLEPDVGLALDPEWAVDPGQTPGRVYGNTTGKELNDVAAYVSGLVKANNLPEKALVFHQVAARVVKNEQALRPHDGVAIIKSVDGIGSRKMKEETWTVLTRSMPKHFHGGFKLFYVEDPEVGPLMTPAQVMALTPQPEYVLYE